MESSSFFYMDVSALTWKAETSRGVYFRKIPPQFAGLSLLEQKSGPNTMKEWSEHKINGIFEFSTLGNPYIDTLFNRIYDFKFFQFFYILELSA